jgi:hypothetical protein
MQVSPKFKAWLKRVGWIGFFFFLAKGIVWLLAGKVLLDWMSELF